MKDFVRFMLRGALGGAMAGATFTLSICLYYFGPSWSLMYLFHPVALAFFAVPGAFVGFVLWLITVVIGKRLIAILRITVGMGVLLTIYFIIVLYELSGHLDRIGFTEFSVSTAVGWLLTWLAVSGALAGLASPSRIHFNKDAVLNYWERVALYEIAQVEARMASHGHAHSIGG